MDLVDQAEPLASFDPLFEGRQHPLCPDRRFDPAPAAQDLSGTFSPCGHCLRLCFPSVWSSRLHLPAPLRSTGITRLLRYYGCSDSWTVGSSALEEHEHRLCCRPGLPAFCHRTFRSFRLQPPAVVPTHFWGFSRRAYRTTSPWPPFRGHASLGLRHCLAGSPRRPAESSSLALRTDRSPPVALHPASRRRSYLRLRSARTPRQGLSPC